MIKNQPIIRFLSASAGFQHRSESSVVEKKSSGNPSFISAPVPKIKKITVGENKLVIIRHPDHRSISYLRKNYQLHPVHLDDIQSPIQRPKVDFEDHYLFFVVHLPVYDYHSRKIKSLEVDFVLTDSDVVVVLIDEIPELDSILADFQKKKNFRADLFAKGSAYLLYWIIDRLVDGIFPLIRQLERGVDEIDKKVFSRQAKSVVEKISFMRRNVIFFQTTIKPELNYFTGLELEEHYLLDEDTKTYMSNISDHLKKIWDRLEDIKELTDNLSDSFESYFSFMTNETIKILTIFSVILMPLTLLASIYGMNLSFLPLAGHLFALPILFFIMGVIVIVMMVYFRYKKWI